MHATVATAAALAVRTVPQLQSRSWPQETRQHCPTGICAQVWLALYNLVVDPACRAKMGLTDSRCDALFKLKRHFTEVLLDQVRPAGWLACWLGCKLAEPGLQRAVHGS